MSTNVDHSNDSELYGSYAYSLSLKNVFYGPGCTEFALPALLKQLGASSAFIVTGKSLDTKVYLLLFL